MCQLTSAVVLCFRVADLGDLDDDGIRDVAVGAPGFHNGSGLVLVLQVDVEAIALPGSDGGLLDGFALANNPTDGLFSAAEVPAGFGRYMTAFDIDEDGQLELLVSTDSSLVLIGLHQKQAAWVTEFDELHGSLAFGACSRCLHHAPGATTDTFCAPQSETLS